MNYIGKDYQKKRIKKHQKFLLKLLHLRIGNYYPLRKWLGIDYKGKIDEITHLSIAYNTKYFKKGKKWFKQVTRTYQQPDLSYKLNLVLDKIPQLALLPALLQPAYGLGALAFFFLTQTTYQPSTKDNVIASNTPDANYGDLTQINVHDYSLPQTSRSLLEFDISDIPANATFSQGDLLLYYYGWNGNDPVGRTVWAYKLTRTDWVELESTWNSYKSGSSWTTNGGDYVTSNPSGDDIAMPAGYGWITWNINSIVQDAYDNTNDVEILVKYDNESQANRAQSLFYSRNYTDDTSLRPKLTVTYTVSVTQKTVSDSGSGAETIGIKAEVGITDSGSGAEIAAVKQFRKILESGVGSELVDAKPTIPVQDSGVGTDLAQVLFKGISIQESGIGSDIISAITAKLFLQDSGIGADVISALSKILVQDSGLGQETTQIKSLVSVNEAGVGADIVKLIVAKLLVQDAGVGAETVEIVQKLLIQDAGIGVDVASVLAKVSVLDLGIGVDKVHLKGQWRAIARTTGAWGKISRKTGNWNKISRDETL